jgi:hypothetical protein
MREQFGSKERSKLKRKMAAVFGENIIMLSKEMQELLLDDLVTAFENRVRVLSKVDSDVGVEVAVSVDYETVQA